MTSRVLYQLKKHPAVVPVFVITVAGAAFAGCQIFRSATTYTDVSFRRKSNPHPWQNVKPTDNYKFFHAVDYSKVSQDERPKYED